MRFKEFMESVEPKVGDLVIQFDKDDNPYAGDVIEVKGDVVKVKFAKGGGIFSKRNLRKTATEKINGKVRNHFHEK